MPTNIFKFLINQDYITLIDIADILILTFIIYQILLWTKKTRAYQLFKGLFILFGIYALTHIIGLSTIDWLMQKLITFFFMVLIVVFQPELRNALERIGRNRYLAQLFNEDVKPKTTFLQNIIKSVIFLAENKHGALIVMEKETGLSEYVESGISLDAKLKGELLTSIFSSKNPLHDGAVIIRENRILAAGCLLPLTDNRVLDKRLGTRHRAAIGLSEQSDAIVIVVSEETGIISIADNGTLTRYLSKETLEERLFNSFSPPPKDKPRLRFWKKSEEANQ